MVVAILVSELSQMSTNGCETYYDVYSNIYTLRDVCTTRHRAHFCQTVVIVPQNREHEPLRFGQLFESTDPRISAPPLKEIVRQIMS